MKSTTKQESRPMPLAINSSDFFPRRATPKEKRDWIEKRFGCKMSAIGSSCFDENIFRRNVENYIGTAQVPVGLAGPLLVRGQHANGLFCVPFATTEGVLVDSYHRGMIAITQSGGATVVLFKDQIDISPIFILEENYPLKLFLQWFKKNFSKLRAIAKTKTVHGELMRYEIVPIALDRIVVTFYYYTQDAMGLNMINVASDAVCRYVKGKLPIKTYYLRSNFSSDKKASYHNFIEGYGKTVLASVFLPSSIIVNYLQSTSDEMFDFWYSSVFSSMQAGMLGINAQFANALAAIYIATGQDVAQIVNASSGISLVEKHNNGLKISIKVPSLVSGTIGGGTQLPTQKECLEIMNCCGNGHAPKFAEIICATLLAGEISICAALASGKFADAHERKRKM